MDKTLSKYPFLLCGLVIGGVLALLESCHVSSHLAFLWVGTFGVLFVLGWPHKKNHSAFILSALVGSLLISIPCIWLIDAPLYYLSPFCLALINALAVTTFYLQFLQSGFRYQPHLLLHDFWHTLSATIITLFFGLICWLILIFTAALFAQANFFFINKLLSHNAFIWFALACFASIGFYITLKNKNITDGFVQFFYFVARYVFIPLALLGMLFIIITLITRHLHFQDHYFLLFAFLSATFINACLIREKEAFQGVWQFIARLFLIMTPVFSILALITVFLTTRHGIQTHGLTAQNFPRLLSVALLLLYNLSYAWLALFSWPHWQLGFQKANIWLAWLLIIATLLGTNPVTLHLSF